MVELKPCPFCGEKTHIEVRRAYSLDTGEEEDACITCMRCLSTFRYEEAVNAEEVMEHWNRRAEDKPNGTD